MSKFISGSEVDQFHSCERKHYYAFGEPCADGSRGIQPKRYSDSLQKGTIGHSLLGEYYLGVMSGLSKGKSFEKSILLTQKEITARGDLDEINLLTEAIMIVKNYIDRYADDDWYEWQPLAIEQEFHVPLNRYNLDLTFVFKPDAIFRHIRTGKIWIWDHKFLYNFYQDTTLAIQPQMTRYAAGLQELGYDVHGALYNMLSTRPNVRTNPFQRLEKPLSTVAMARYWDEMLQTAGKITELKNLSSYDWPVSVTRTASDFNCKHCPFLDLCSTDLEGRPGRNLLVQNFYEPNTYGYGRDKNSKAIEGSTVKEIAQ